MVLRSVPVVALAPIIALIFGNGYGVVAVMSGIVEVYGGGNWVAWHKIGFPSALSSPFASIRISVPKRAWELCLPSRSLPARDRNAVVIASAASSNSQVWALVVAVAVAVALVSVVLNLWPSWWSRWCSRGEGEQLGGPAEVGTRTCAGCRRPCRQVPKLAFCS